MIVYRAAWVCPISRPPIENGWVAVDEGRIRAVGGHDVAPPQPLRDLGRVAILPGLVNAHTHLELSWLRGRVPPAATFVEWIRQMMLTRGGRFERADDQNVLDAAQMAAAEMREAGTAAVGDISNSLASVDAIRTSGMRGVVFHELLGFKATNGQPVLETRSLREAARVLGDGAVRISLAPHAPYSVSRELFCAIRDEVDGSAVPITSVHLAESEGEIEFLRDGSGPWPGILAWLGAARDDWQPPAQTPVEYLDALGMLDARTLVVHGVQLTDSDLRRLADLGSTVVTCPRSNQWVGVGVPPLERFYSSGVKVAVGTDSLASVEDLNVFSELKTMRWLARSVPACRLLESATRVGAEALGLGDELGTIDPGKRAALIGVDLEDAFTPAASAADLEEHLLTGVDPRRVTWLAA
jgi:aminodeoxyfutalosine deaminase